MLPLSIIKVAAGLCRMSNLLQADIFHEVNRRSIPGACIQFFDSQLPQS